MTFCLGIHRPPQGKTHLPRIWPGGLIETNRDKSGLIRSIWVISKSLYDHEQPFSAWIWVFMNSLLLLQAFADAHMSSLSWLKTFADAHMSSLSLLKMIWASANAYVPINSKLQHPLPGQTPGIWTFLNLAFQIPHHLGKKCVQMPHRHTENYEKLQYKRQEISGHHTRYIYLKSGSRIRGTIHV